MGDTIEKVVVLAVSKERKSQEAMHWAFHHAKETRKKVRAVYVTNQDESDGKKYLEDFEKQARTFQIGYDTRLMAGEYFTVCENLSKEAETSVIVLLEKKKGFFKKLFEGSELDGLQTRLGCEMKVYQV